MKKKNFWLLEDDDMTQFVVSSYIMNFLSMDYVLRVVASAKEITAEPGDIILSDQHGVDIEKLRPNGALVISMSGNKGIIVDIHKPFRSKQLEEVLSKKLGINIKKAA